MVVDRLSGIREFCSEVEGGDESGILLADGLEGAFIGIGRQYHNPPVAIYDYGRCIEILAEGFRGGDSEGDVYEEAEEWMSFNVTGAWVGERTPIFMMAYPGGREDLLRTMVAVSSPRKRVKRG